MDEFVAIDFETGMYAPSSAVSVGLVKYRGCEPVDAFYSLVRPPQLYVRPDFTEIHGLTVDDVRDAPDFAQVWEEKARDFIGAIPLAAHNASFDAKVLGATLAHYGIPLPDIEYFCSLALARRVWPGLRSHALTALGRKFDIVYDAHNALADAQTCGKIVSLCVAEMSEKKGAGKPIAVADALREAGVKMKRLIRE